MDKKMSNVKKLTIIGMLIALSAVGALIQLPGTTIALDSMPGFFAALFLGPGLGALVAGLGHLLNAMIKGFPYSVPVHLIVVVQMAVTALIFGWIYRKTNYIVACIVAIILNGPIALLILVPILGWPAFYGLIAPLTIASAVNVIIAYVVYMLVKDKIK